MEGSQAQQTPPLPPERVVRCNFSRCKNRRNRFSRVVMGYLLQRRFCQRLGTHSRRHQEIVRFRDRLVQRLGQCRGLGGANALFAVDEVVDRGGDLSGLVSGETVRYIFLDDLALTQTPSEGCESIWKRFLGFRLRGKRVSKGPFPCKTLATVERGKGCDARLGEMTVTNGTFEKRACVKAHFVQHAAAHFQAAQQQSHELVPREGSARGVDVEHDIVDGLGDQVVVRCLKGGRWGRTNKEKNGANIPAGCVV